MNTPTREQQEQLARERAIERAEHDIPIIEQLLESQAWAYLSRRLNERRQQFRDTIADNDNLSDAETRALRRVLQEYDAILHLPHVDRQVLTGVLEDRTRRANGPARG
jgi:hypothetical protein